MQRSAFIAAFAILFSIATPASAQSGSPEPVKLAPGLFQLHGTDPATGTEYVRFILSAETAGTGSAQSGPKNSPDFIVECTQLQERRKLSFYLTTGPVQDIGFVPPFRRTPGHRSAPKYPSVVFIMSFDGYTRSKPFKTVWEKLPNGTYWFRNPSFRSPNLQGPNFFLQYMNSLPHLRMAPGKPDEGGAPALSFQTGPLLQQVSHDPLCQP